MPKIDPNHPRYSISEQKAYYKELAIEQGLNTKRLQKMEKRRRGVPKHEMVDDGYHPEICEVVHEMVMDGKTRRAISKHLGIHFTTLARWAHKYPEFKEALNPHEEMTNEVEMSVFGRAKGYKYKAQKPVAVRGAVEIVEYEEQALPDMTAAKMWLQAHNPQKWSDKSMVAHEVGGLRDVLKRVAEDKSGLEALGEYNEAEAIEGETPSE